MRSLLFAMWPMMTVIIEKPVPQSVSLMSTGAL